MVIESQRDLLTFSERLRTARYICLDTEFAGERRYYPEVGTLQIAAPTAEGDQIALVDTLAVHDLAPLRRALTDPAVVKVFHALEQDLAILFRLLGEPVRPVFDTQVAAALLGYSDRISFGDLVERVTGVRLEKGHTFTDWLRRPLTPSQVEYALDDVRYLMKAYEALIQELSAKGRLDWASEDFVGYEDPFYFAPLDERSIYLRVRGAERLSGKALAVLQELASWRESTARSQNMPPEWIAIDAALMDLARRPRKSVRELREIRGLQPRQIERFGLGFIDAIRRGIENPPPPPKQRVSFPAEFEPTTDFLVLCLRAIAHEQGIASSLLANRADLSAVVVSGSDAKVPLLEGWRRGAAGEAILAVLEGKATARIVPNTKRVHLEWQH